MKIQPFRIKASKELDDYSEVFEFIVHGSKKEKAPYEVEINIDRLNELGITNMSCTCPHFQFRGEQIEGKCKHINKCLEILKEYGILEKETDIIKTTHSLIKSESGGRAQESTLTNPLYCDEVSRIDGCSSSSVHKAKKEEEHEQ
ncbi:MAG: hypothetical protein ACTSQA_00065 [Candidatus Heimdallarchaeaceae archaeon]